jgi:hypothetical protein
VFLGIPIPAALASDPANQAKIAALNSQLTPYQLAYDQDAYLVKNDWQINDKQGLSSFVQAFPGPGTPGFHHQAQLHGTGILHSG